MNKKGTIFLNIGIILLLLGSIIGGIYYYSQIRPFQLQNEHKIQCNVCADRSCSVVTCNSKMDFNSWLYMEKSKDRFGNIMQTSNDAAINFINDNNDGFGNNIFSETLLAYHPELKQKNAEQLIEDNIYCFKYLEKSRTNGVIITTNTWACVFDYRGINIAQISEYRNIISKSRIN